MTYIQHDKIVKKINSRDGNDNRFEDNYLQNKYHTSVTAISSFARGDLIAFWVRVIQWATVVESIACAEAIGGSRTHLTRHSPVCFAGWPACAVLCAVLMIRKRSFSLNIQSKRKNFISSKFLWVRFPR